MLSAELLHARMNSLLINLLRSIVCVSLFAFAVADNVTAQAIRHPDTTYVEGSNRIHVYKELGLTILSVDHGLQYVFVPKNVAQFAAVALEKHFRFMINASFFDTGRLNAQHAGWLRIFGTIYAPVRNDRQLTHIVRHDTASGATDIVARQDFKPSPSVHTIEFQTGPLVIHQNRVASGLIANSVNGSGRYTRTLIAVGGKNELWFITVRNRVSLDSLGRFLLSLSIFQKKRIEVVNLDGGPSVAFYARSFPELNYNVEDRLPLLLGVK